MNKAKAATSGRKLQGVAAKPVLGPRATSTSQAFGTYLSIDALSPSGDADHAKD